MKTELMVYKEVLESRLTRKKQELNEIEKTFVGTEGIVTNVEKRKFIELKAIVNELENCIDIAQSMVKLKEESS
jgi:hypothetical protein